MYVRKFFDISTAHLTQETRDALDEGHGPTPIFRHPDRYGWFIWVPDAPEIPEIEECPPDLMACILLARRHDCDYLLIDRDAELHPELTDYEEPEQPPADRKIGVVE